MTTENEIETRDLEDEEVRQHLNVLGRDPSNAEIDSVEGSQ